AFEPVERPHADPVLISRGHLADFVVSAAKCGNRFRHPLDPLPDHIARGIERLAEHLDAGHGVAERAFDVAMQPRAVALRLRRPWPPERWRRLRMEARERRRRCVRRRAAGEPADEHPEGHTPTYHYGDDHIPIAQVMPAALTWLTRGASICATVG